MKVDKLIQWPCKQENCFKPALYEFTDIKDMLPKGSLEASEYQKTITLGYSCENHVEEVSKLLKEIYNGD